MTEPHGLNLLKHSAGAALLALLTASGTLVCCVLPALMVALGAGAALAGLISAAPWLVWLSMHKGLVFGVAGGTLAASGWLLLQARHAPCPADPALARACRGLRRFSVWTWGLAAGATSLGALFAFGWPLLID
ncbi:MAG: hypothetical protein MUE46_06630 [Xanthomonadales bacterium]|jgi:hypothetical protein|nr:hypothetical protein [Xanthomonadales bacterium]